MDGLAELLGIVATGEFEDTGSMRIVDAHWSADRLNLRAEVKIADEHHSSWNLRFVGVVEHSLTVVVDCGLNIWRDHPVVNQHTHAREFLHFACAPHNPDEVVGALWAAHRDAVDDWIPFDRYLNRELPLARILAAGSGLLAEGPDFLIEGYASVLSAYRCDPTRQVLPGGPTLKNGLVAHFGESYVVAESILALRLAA